MARKKEKNNDNDDGKYGQFVDPEGLLERTVQCLTLNLPERGGNMGARGEKGTGKTLMYHKVTDEDDPFVVDLWKSVKYEGEPLNVPELLKFSAHEEQGYVDTVAQDILVGGETQVREQIILKWLKPCKKNTPRLLLIDEANFLSPAVAGFMHSLCDWQSGLWVPELSTYYRRDPLHFMALCVNPFEKSVYTGTKEMNVALADRFVWLDIPYMSESDETEWLRKVVPEAEYADVRKVVGFANKTRMAYRMDLLHVPVTPRNLLDWLRMLTKNKMKVDELKPFVTGMQLLDQAKPTLALWEGKDIEDVFKQAIDDDDY